jgi:rubrerythrin
MLKESAAPHKMSCKFQLYAQLGMCIPLFPAVLLPVLLEASLVWYAIWIVIGGALGAVLYLKVLDRSRQAELEAKHCCPDCGYSLRGLRIPQCPECGVIFSPWDPDDHPIE